MGDQESAAAGRSRDTVSDSANRFVLDLETQRSFDEVGGAHNRDQLGISLVGVYHYRDDAFRGYREEDLGRLGDILRDADDIVGFNLAGFDMPLLAVELGAWVLELPITDLMLEAQKALGHRVSLQSIASATLGSGKLGSGLDALQYYRAGDWDRLERYCLEDVRLTRDLYEYARREGHLFYQRGSKRGMFPVGFAKSPYAELFHEAARRRGSVNMRYGAKERLVDVHRFDGSYIRGYCHLRREVLTFRIDRVEAAELAPSSDPLFG